MFSTIQTYSPTGYPRPVPHIAANVDNYNKYVRKNLEKARLFKLNKTQFQSGSEDFNDRAALSPYVIDQPDPQKQMTKRIVSLSIQEEDESEELILIDDSCNNNGEDFVSKNAAASLMSESVQVEANKTNFKSSLAKQSFVVSETPQKMSQDQH